MARLRWPRMRGHRLPGEPRPDVVARERAAAVYGVASRSVAALGLGATNRER